MHHETITFQQATHFLPKIALRLEYLLRTAKQASEETNPIIHHYALQNVTEIMQLIQKPELKSRFLKELIRIEHHCLKNNSCISEELHTKLYAQIQTLTHAVGRFGDGLHQDNFLYAIRSSQTAQAAECEMQSPQLVYWLEGDAGTRQEHVNAWLAALRPLQDTVTIYLALLRSSAEFKEILLYNGFYQQPLPPRSFCHLIMIRMNIAARVVPVIQLGHHGLSLRLCDASSMKEVKETDAKLDIAICQL